MRLPLFQVIYDTLCNHSLYAHNFPYCKRNKYLNYQSILLAPCSHTLTIGHDCLSRSFPLT
jgi:hypothetical protein